MTKNMHNVPGRRWRKWPEQSRRVFNELYELMEDQSLFLHPDAVPSPPEQWDTTRWNAAWLAADLAQVPREHIHIAA